MADDKQHPLAGAGSPVPDFAMVDPDEVQARRKAAEKELAAARQVGALTDKVDRARGKLDERFGGGAPGKKLAELLGEGATVQIEYRDAKGNMQLCSHYRLSEIEVAGNLDSFMTQVIRPRFGDQEFIISVLKPNADRPAFFRRFDKLALGGEKGEGTDAVALAQVLLNHRDQQQGGGMGAREVLEMMKSFAEVNQGKQQSPGMMEMLILGKMLEDKPTPVTPPDPAAALAPVLGAMQQQNTLMMQQLQASQERAVVASAEQNKVLMTLMQPVKQPSVLEQLTPLLAVLAPVIAPLVERLSKSDEQRHQVELLRQEQKAEQRAAEDRAERVRIESKAEADRQRAEAERRMDKLGDSLMGIKDDLRAPQRGIADTVEEFKAILSAAEVVRPSVGFGPPMGPPPLEQSGGGLLDNLPGLMAAGATLIEAIRGGGDAAQPRPRPMPPRQMPRQLPRPEPPRPAPPQDEIALPPDLPMPPRIQAPPAVARRPTVSPEEVAAPPDLTPLLDLPKPAPAAVAQALEQQQASQAVQAAPPEPKPEPNLVRLNEESSPEGILRAVLDLVDEMGTTPRFAEKVLEVRQAAAEGRWEEILLTLDIVSMQLAQEGHLDPARRQVIHDALASQVDDLLEQLASKLPPPGSITRLPNDNGDALVHYEPGPEDDSEGPGSEVLL